MEQAIQAVRDGRAVVIFDGLAGDLVLAAEATTAAAINFMAREARGVIGLALTGEHCDRLGLTPMAGCEQSGPTVSIEARDGVTTGISAADRARTIAIVTDPRSSARDLVRPGRTEGAVDLARLAGRAPAATTCTILDDAGDAADRETLEAYCARHRLPLVTVAALKVHRRRVDPTIERVVATPLPTANGDFIAVGYRSLTDSRRHVAFINGDGPVTIHVENLMRDVFGRGLDDALNAGGVLIHIGREDRGLFGPPDATAEEREIAEQILADLARQPAAVDVEDLARDVARAG
jgi:3,4-dihydroxy 2-butanone 4-phosphate synthase/GTP cyclohydrolase II